jgi:hypothetical protein
MFLKPPDVCVKDTGTSKGRGVFALRSFSIDEVVETCPVVPLNTIPDALPESLKNMVFHWDWRPDGNGTSALALGYGTLYNHDNPANMRYEVDRQSRLIRFIAVRNIFADEELTVNYSGDDGASIAEDDWWFREKDQTPILSTHTPDD